jgi:hypothetical protein
MRGRFIQLIANDTNGYLPSDDPKEKIDYIFLSANNKWEMKNRMWSMNGSLLIIGLFLEL